MDAPFNTSVILLVAVALWLIWVAPYLLRRRKHVLATDAAAVIPLPEAALPAIPAPRPQASMTMEIKQPQEIRMKTTSTTAGTGPSATALQSRPKPPGSVKAPANSPAPLKIHYGRLLVALVGLLALLTAAVTGVLRLAGLVHGLIPATACAVFLVSLVMLRLLAVRGRKKRLNAAFRDAMGTTTASSRLAGPASVSPAARTQGTFTDAGRTAQQARNGAERIAPSTQGGAERAPQASRPAVVLFDGAAGTKPEAPAKQLKPLTATELRNAALAVAAKGAADAQVATTETVGEVESWQPVEIPRPSYVAAARAERPAPAPLDLPEAPRPTGKTSIKATEAAAANQATEAAAANQATEAAGAYPATEAKSAAEGAPEEAATPTAPSASDQTGPQEAAAVEADSAPAPAAAGKARPAHGLSNLDVVLQRRRA